MLFVANKFQKKNLTLVLMPVIRNRKITFKTPFEECKEKV
jgi:hypothetical protein